MLKIDAVIVDDGEFSIIDLKDELQVYSDIEVIETFQNSLKALDFINRKKPKLLFLDIEMPLLNGFQLVAKLKYNPLIIFCTGFSKYAVEGYDYSPTDFILKPIRTEKFKNAIQKVFHDLENNTINERLDRQRNQLGYLPVSFKDESGNTNTVFIWLEELSLIEPDLEIANHIKFTLKSGQTYSTKMTLKQFHEFSNSKSDSFIQVHKSFIVNRSHIKQIQGKTDLILNIQEQEIFIPISRRFKHNLSV